MSPGIPMNQPQPTSSAVDAAELARLYQIAETNFPGGALGGYALPADIRYFPERAHGSKIETADGKTYVDFVCGAGAMILGHTHPAVTSALDAQMRLGTHFFGTLNRPAIKLSEMMRGILPHAEKVAFTTTGSEATAYALRMARAFTGRDKVLKFDGAYHGNHDYSVINFASTKMVNYPQGSPDTGGVPPGVTDTVLIAPYNDLEITRRIVAENSADIAAIIVEPIQRVVPPQPGFLEGLRALCDAYDIILVFDEVVTGFRLALGGAQEYFGIRADLAAYGKVLGAGIGIGAVAGRADLVSLAAPTMKGKPDYAYLNGTLHGNPLGCAAGIAMLTELSKPSFFADLNTYSAEFRKEAQAVLDRHGTGAIVAGEGSLWQILFLDRQPKNHQDLLKANMDRVRKWDAFAMKSGFYVLLGVRRFWSGANTEEDAIAFLRHLDEACRTL